MFLIIATGVKPDSAKWFLLHFLHIWIKKSIYILNKVDELVDFTWDRKINNTKNCNNQKKFGKFKKYPVISISIFAYYFLYNSKTYNLFLFMK